MNPTRYLPALLLLGLLAAPAMAAPVQAPHIEAELISETAGLHAGENTLALRLKPDAGWHTYWLNPGDSGLATQLHWTLPPGVAASNIQWPYPQRFTLGEVTNYGYDEETLHLVTLNVPQDWPANKPLELNAQARWLVCADVCIPGRAEFIRRFPVSATVTMEQQWQAAFSKARARLPQASPELAATFGITQTQFSLQVAGRDFRHATVDFFPAAPRLVKASAARHQTVDAAGFRQTQNLADDFSATPADVSGVLVVTQAGQTRAYAIQARPGAVVPVPATSAPSKDLPIILLLALLGGLILNLMPCVFPVLSLKAMAVMQSRNHSAQKQRRHALAYTAGVLLSCGAVAALLLGLRAGGEAIGWGFQLQSPVFIGALAYLMFALGLSLSGVAEFGGRFMGVGQSLTTGDNAASSFFTGVLATVVASPCTAPFMGTALGYALTQSPLVSLSIFFTLGLGLALPFLLLGFFPRLAAFLPRPGAWMETFKQAMAFPLYLTAVWLLWVLMQQSGADAAAIALIGLVLVAFALWLWHRDQTLARLLRIAALIIAALLLAHPALRAQTAAHRVEPAALSQAYSDERLAQLLAEKRTVFVNLTADWCLTCKVNEHVVLSTNAVRQAFKQKNVAVLVGDWTRSDPAITRVLERFGRSGVPLYLMFVNGGEPRVLPQILTPQILLDALNNGLDP